MSERKEFKISIIYQVAALFAIGVLLIGSLSSFIYHRLAIEFVTEHFNHDSEACSRDLEIYLKQYPAYEWLVEYWCAHFSELDVEYNLDYRTDVVSAQKVRELNERHPTLRLEYAKPYEIEALPEKDQKLYAEIIYSWMISRIDQMAEAYELDYIYAMATKKPYDKQTIVFASSKDDLEIGEEKGQLNPVGKETESTSQQQETIARTVTGQPSSSLNADGKYLDFYYLLDSIRGVDILIGISRNVTTIRKTIDHEALMLSIVAAIFFIALAAVFMMMINKVVIKPLKKVERNIRRYKDSKDSAGVLKSLSHINSHNELANLSNDVCDLTKEMDDYMDKIENISAEREHIRTELTLAGKIQHSMLPKRFVFNPPRKEIEIYASMTPAREIGGDFYDFFMVDYNHMCMLIADVSDKGIPAALFMMASKITLSHTMSVSDSPAIILEEVNKSICKNNPEDMFVTVWLGLLDLRDGTMRCCNAGHEYPILKQPGKEFEQIKDKHGLVVGSIEDAKYSEYTLKLEPGAKLFVYTDGIPEASNPRNEMFGLERTLDELNNNLDNSPEEILNNMKKSVNEFVEDREPFDDLTMMCLHYKGPQL